MTTQDEATFQINLTSQEINTIIQAIRDQQACLNDLYLTRRTMLSWYTTHSSYLNNLVSKLLENGPSGAEK
jgi:hypothetical protein